MMKKLPGAELEVMKVLWGHNKSRSASDIMKELSITKEWSISTVQALLARLGDRGFVKSIKEGRLNFFETIVQEEEYKLLETQWFLSKIHNNSVTNLVASLITSSKLSKSDLDELEELIRKAE